MFYQVYHELGREECNRFIISEGIIPFFVDVGILRFFVAVMNMGRLLLSCREMTGLLYALVKT